jgi:hypothetical protein
VLFAVMSGYLMVLNKVNFTVQKDLLEFCLTLVDPVQSKITTVETNIASMETEIRAAGTNPNMTLING